MFYFPENLQRLFIYDIMHNRAQELPTEDLAGTTTLKNMATKSHYHLKLIQETRIAFGICFHQEHLRATRSSHYELSIRICYHMGKKSLVILHAATIRSHS